MNKLLALATFGLIFLTTGCKDNFNEKLEQALDKNPDLIFKLMEKNPDKFIQSAQNAARKARPPQAAGNSPQADQEADLKSPKTVPMDKDRVIGNQNGDIVIVKYTDLECPFCSRGYSVVQEVEKAYAGRVKLVFKHLPLPMHPGAMPAAQYYEAVAAVHGVDKAYKWAGAIFARQSEFRTQGATVNKFFEAEAKKMGLNVAKIKSTLANAKEMEKIKARIQADSQEAAGLGIQGTPGFLVNGVRIKGAYPFPMFKEVIEKTLAKPAAAGAAAQPN